MSHSLCCNSVLLVKSCRVTGDTVPVSCICDMTVARWSDHSSLYKWWLLQPDRAVAAIGQGWHRAGLTGRETLWYSLVNWQVCLGIICMFLMGFSVDFVPLASFLHFAHPKHQICARSVIRNDKYRLFMIIVGRVQYVKNTILNTFSGSSCSNVKFSFYSMMLHLNN